MTYLEIEGTNHLSGNVAISGAKKCRPTLDRFKHTC